ncbi:MAG: hypothetical protein WCA19_10405 [Candidatus Acidiferrales bacterium]
MLKTRTAVILIVACSAIFGLLGAAGGGEYAMSRMDALEGPREVERAKDATKQREAFQQVEQTAEQLSQQVMACNSAFATQTVLYEPAPGLQLSLGLHGLGVAPSANQAPKWVIPARVKPLVLAGTQGAVYYYMTADNRLDGPYIPQVAAQQ